MKIWFCEKSANVVEGAGHVSSARMPSVFARFLSCVDRGEQTSEQTTLPSPSDLLLQQVPVPVPVIHLQKVYADCAPRVYSLFWCFFRDILSAVFVFEMPHKKKFLEQRAARLRENR